MRKRYACLATLVLRCATTFSRAQVDDTAAAKRYIEESETQWAAAEVTGDTALVDRIVADDFVGVDPSGVLYHKVEAVAEVHDGKGTYISNELKMVCVRFFGDTAVAQGTEVWEKKAGRPKRGSYVWTDTWIKRNNQWQIVAAEDLILPR